MKLLDYFSQVFFAFPVQIFSPSFKASAQHPKKLFIVDLGLVNQFTGESEIGKNMENVVFLQLYRFASREGFQINYWKEYGKSEGLEVDFVISRNNKVVQLINVSYAGSMEEVRPREIKSLEKVSKELGCKKLTIITWDFLKEDEIAYVPLWYWLLNTSRLIF
ncbi:ATPase [mine drainage metagenome]|uniref:ATPase n=1 Tax=mine drainage metagenome TaxID=410659 RepID=T1A1N4_9ZZZZ